jgi:uncharacterized protein (DUF433 family)
MSHDTKPAAPVVSAGRFDRITFEPGKMAGRACIRGLRITVGLVLSRLADVTTSEAILADYPDFEFEDIRQALGYAAWLAREEVRFAEGD